MPVSYLGLFRADSPLQLRHGAFGFRDLCDFHQQPGPNIFTVSTLAKTLCVHTFNCSSQTNKEVRGRIHVSQKEMLHVSGRVQLDSRRSGQRELHVRGNFSHRFTVKSSLTSCTVQSTVCVTCGWLLLLLQLQLPSFAAVEADVCWSPKNNSDFNYQAKGKLRVQRQECRVGDSAFLTCWLLYLCVCFQNDPRLF